MSLADLLTASAVAPLPDTAWLRVTGSDRVRWLNGMATNSIQALQPGEGNYNFLLNAQGRIQGDLTAFLLDDYILLETSADQIESLTALLDRFIIMDDVELQDWNKDRAGISIVGPEAESLLRSTGFGEPLDSIQLAQRTSEQELFWRYFDWKPRPNPWPVEFIRAHSPLVPRYEIWSNTGIIDEVRQALEKTGATLTTPESLEDLRLLEGTPRYATDIRNSDTAKDLPQETNQTRALHFNKGCYLGQEIVERIRSRGQVHRTFTGFLLTGELPAPGTPLTSGDKPVGELTSVAAISHPSAGPLQLALGYIRREALEGPARATPLTYPNGTANPILLPYRMNPSS